MKKRALSLFLILILTLNFFVSCGKDRETEKKEFTHCELTLILDDSFVQEESEDYDLLVTDGEVVVSLLRISFLAGAESGIPPTYTAKGFAAYFMNKTEKSNELLMYGDVPYYMYMEEYGGNKFFHTVTFYRSYEAYFVVGYSINGEADSSYVDRFLEYADAAYFNNAPDITTK